MKLLSNSPLLSYYATNDGSAVAAPAFIALYCAPEKVAGRVRLRYTRNPATAAMLTPALTPAMAPIEKLEEAAAPGGGGGAAASRGSSSGSCAIEYAQIALAAATWFS